MITPLSLSLKMQPFLKLLLLVICQGYWSTFCDGHESLTGCLGNFEYPGHKFQLDLNKIPDEEGVHAELASDKEQIQRKCESSSDSQKTQLSSISITNPVIWKGEINEASDDNRCSNMPPSSGRHMLLNVDLETDHESIQKPSIIHKKRNRPSGKDFCVGPRIISTNSDTHMNAWITRQPLDKEIPCEITIQGVRSLDMSLENQDIDHSEKAAIEGLIYLSENGKPLEKDTSAQKASESFEKGQKWFKKAKTSVLSTPERNLLSESPQTKVMDRGESSEIPSGKDLTVDISQMNSAAWGSPREEVSKSRNQPITGTIYSGGLLLKENTDGTPLISIEPQITGPQQRSIKKIRPKTKVQSLREISLKTWKIQGFDFVKESGYKSSTDIVLFPHSIWKDIKSGLKEKYPMAGYGDNKAPQEVRNVCPLYDVRAHANILWEQRKIIEDSCEVPSKFPDLRKSKHRYSSSDMDFKKYYETLSKPEMYFTFSAAKPEEKTDYIFKLIRRHMKWLGQDSDEYFKYSEVRKYTLTPLNTSEYISNDFLKIIEF